MKRIGYILTEQSLTIELCKKAILEASKNKRDRPAVIRVLNEIDKHASILRELILNGNYRPRNYKECHIIDKPSGKARVLEKPVFFPDQCVHHVSILLIYDRLLKRLDPYCLCGIKGRGIYYGYLAIKRWLREDKEHTKYCLQGDVRKCYENIKPELVMKSFKKFVKDKRYLALIKIIAFSYPSLPLGNYTSTWFCNLILTGLDITARNSKGCYHYLRYADDFIALGSSKRDLHKARLRIAIVLRSMGLELKRNWQVYRVDVRGIDMLGFRFYRTYVIMRKRNALALMRAVRKWIKSPAAHIARGLLSRMGQLKHVNSFNFRQKYLRKLNLKKLKEAANNGC